MPQCTEVHHVPAGVNRGPGNPGAVITDSCEPPRKVGNQTQVLCKSGKCSQPLSHLTSPLFLIFLRNLHYDFHSGYTNLHPHQHCVNKGSLFSKTPQASAVWFRARQRVSLCSLGCPEMCSVAELGSNITASWHSLSWVLRSLACASSPRFYLPVSLSALWFHKNFVQFFQNSL